MNIIKRLLWRFSKKYRIKKWTELRAEYQKIYNDLEQFLNKVD